jgi:hypothetical protein
MSEKKKYDLEFVYEDNGQVYSDCLELTNAEVAILESALQCLVNAGCVHSPDGDGGIENMLVPYSEPVFVTLDQLKENWKYGSLGQVLEDADFTWEPSSESAPALVEVFHCQGCGREEGVCSADPCPSVVADRESL